MYFKVKQPDFLRAITRVLPAVETKPSGLGLHNIKIETAGKNLILYAHDTNLSLHASAKADIIEPGSYGVAGKSLAELIALYPDEEIEVRVNGENRLQFKTQRTAAHLSMTKCENFPMFPPYHQFKFEPVEKFMETVEKVLFCAFTDIIKPLLTGVYIEKDRLVATDAHRLAMASHKFPIEKPILVPAVSFGHLKKALDPTLPLGIYATENELHFSNQDLLATVRFLEGQYPNYRALFPQGPYDIINVKKSDLLHAMKLVSVIVADKGRSTCFDFLDGILTITSESSELGKIQEKIEAQHAQPIKIYLSSKYLTQALTHLEKDIVTLELRNPQTPILIKEDGYVQIIMPQRGPG